GPRDPHSRPRLPVSAARRIACHTPMLRPGTRESVSRGARAPVRFEDTPGMDGQVSEPSPTLPGMGDDSATVTAEAPDAARRPSAGLAAARSAIPEAGPPVPHVAPDAARRPSAGLAEAPSASPEAEPPDPHVAPDAARRPSAGLAEAPSASPEAE